MTNAVARLFRVPGQWGCDVRNPWSAFWNNEIALFKSFGWLNWLNCVLGAVARLCRDINQSRLSAGSSCILHSPTCSHGVSMESIRSFKDFVKTIIIFLQDCEAVSS